MQQRMAQTVGFVLSAIVLSVASTAALALDYRSVTDNAILYDAPSAKGVKRYIVLRGTPVEVVFAQDKWTKVRDSSGNMAWIESQQLASTRTVLVRAERGEIRAEANDKSPPVFFADKNVVLDLVQAAPPGWARVKHRDGQTGYIKAAQVWGL